MQRMDIGECAAIHDLALRADYEQASESKDYGYQVDVMLSPHFNNCTNLIVIKDL